MPPDNPPVVNRNSNSQGTRKRRTSGVAPFARGPTFHAEIQLPCAAGGTPPAMEPGQGLGQGQVQGQGQGPGLGQGQGPEQGQNRGVQGESGSWVVDTAILLKDAVAVPLLHSGYEAAGWGKPAVLSFGNPAL